MNKSLAKLTLCALLAACGADDSAGEIIGPDNPDPGSNTPPTGPDFGTQTGSEDGNAPTLPRVVEESDIYWLEGNTLYVQSLDRGLTTIDVSQAHAPITLDRIEDVANGSTELYVRDGNVLLLHEQSNNCAFWPHTDAGDYSVISELTAVDSEISKVAGRYCLAGKIVASRLVGDELYVVTSDINSKKTWVTSLDVRKFTAPTQIASVKIDGYSDEIHANNQAIFVASAPGDPASITTVSYIDISDRAAVLRGQIEIDGEPQGRFHMDATPTTFRIVTYDWFESAAKLAVISIDDPDNLKLLGLSEKIGFGEQLYATRFVGDLAFVVTFRQIDPLWVLSLRDPSQPKIIGELEVPGWSDFIFPRGNRLVTVGRGDAGQKVAASLFDISDLANPSLVKRLEFGDDNASSEANSDFRAVTLIDAGILGDGALLAVPVTNQGTFGQETCGSQLQLIDLSDENLSLRGTISREGRVKRAATVTDHLYSFSNGEVSAIDVSNRDEPIVAGSVGIGDPFADCVSSNTSQAPGGWNEGGFNEGRPDDDWEAGPMGCRLGLRQHAGSHGLGTLLLFAAACLLRRRSTRV